MNIIQTIRDTNAKQRAELEALPTSKYCMVKLSPRTYIIIEMDGSWSQWGDEPFKIQGAKMVCDKPLAYAPAKQLLIDKTLLWVIDNIARQANTPTPPSPK